MRPSFRRHFRFRQKKAGHHWGRVIFGFLAMAASVWLLWVNEGRVNLADVANDSIPVETGIVEPRREGELIAVTGRLTTPGPIGDDRYLRAGDYVQIYRWVEMFAWVEEETSSDDDERSYVYKLEWTDDPRPADSFDWPEGHENPPLTARNETITARSAAVGEYHIEPHLIHLPRPEPLALSYQNVFEGSYRLQDDHIYQGKGTPDAPQLGDVRVSFSVVPANILVTAFGRQSGSEISRYHHNGGAQLYRVLTGDRSQALDQLNSEYRNLLWGFRFLGFLLMWMGLNLLVSPLTFMLRFIPTLGNIGRWLLRGITLTLALTFSLTLIVVSAIAHNTWAILVLLLLVAGGLVLWQRRQYRDRIHTHQ